MEPKDVRELLGHASPIMTDRHLRPLALDDLTAKIAPPPWAGVV